MMLHASNLTKYFGDTPVLLDVSFTLGHGDRAAIVGPNGSGKTTLARIVVGAERADDGAVRLAPGARAGYLRQGFLGDETAPVAAVIEPDGAVWTAYMALQGATEELAVRSDDPAALRCYEQAAATFEDLGGYPRLAMVDEVLRGLDLDGLDPARRIGTLSGGQKTRLALAGLLLGQPDLLVLDEPTNHLDVDALRWLESFIARYQGSVLLVSHDRAFLDATATTILELDEATHTLTAYAGNYSAYVATKEAERAAQWEAFHRQERERKRIAEDIRRMQEQARGVEAKTQLDYLSGTRSDKGAARTRAAKVARKAKVREHKLERSMAEHTVEKPRASWALKLDFTPQAGGAREVLRAEGLRMSYGDGPVLDGVDLHLRHGERVVLTGPNGGGKSTLLKIICGELAPEAGAVRLGANVVVGYYSQEQEGLDPRATPLETIRAAAPLSETEARSLLHLYLFSGDDVFTPVERLSYGERARLVLARLVLSGANLLVLDEPTNHLDIPARERFEQALASFSGTVLAVLHDRYLIERLATRVVELRNGTLHEVDLASWDRRHLAS